jgi:hypothetical protein
MSRSNGNAVEVSPLSLPVFSSPAAGNSLGYQAKRPLALDRHGKETILAVTLAFGHTALSRPPTHKVHPRFLDLHARVVLFETLAKPYLGAAGKP